MSQHESGLPCSSTATPHFDTNCYYPDDTIDCCTSCGSANVRWMESGGRMCSQTGYRESDYWRCYTCGARSEDVDEVPTILIIPNGIFQPTFDDLVRWSLELVERAKAEKESEEAA